MLRIITFKNTHVKINLLTSPARRWIGIRTLYGSDLEASEDVVPIGFGQMRRFSPEIPLHSVRELSKKGST
jgi:hypothetical protein